MENREVPDILKQIRAKLKLSQEELANRFGVAFSTLNRWENGKSTPRGKAKQAIADLMSEVGFDATQTGSNKHQRRRNSREDLLTTKSMEQMLWSAACSIRGEKDAPKFKDYILPLVFIKRLSDVFEDEVLRLVLAPGRLQLGLMGMKQPGKVLRLDLLHRAVSQLRE